MTCQHTQLNTLHDDVLTHAWQEVADEASLHVTEAIKESMLPLLASRVEIGMRMTVSLACCLVLNHLLLLLRLLLKGLELLLLRRLLLPLLLRVLLLGHDDGELQSNYATNYYTIMIIGDGQSLSVIRATDNFWKQKRGDVPFSPTTRLAEQFYCFDKSTPQTWGSAKVG